MTYEMDIAGLKRELPLCKVTDDLYIGAFVMFGDVELTVHCAAELLKRAPEYDYLIAPEAKAIPLLYEMARQSGAEKYFLARKGPKAYMSGVFEVHVKSITTMDVQRLVIDTADAELIKGKRILIVDDVISTGESLRAMEELVTRAGGSIVGRMAVLAEGAAQKRDVSSCWAIFPCLIPTAPSKPNLRIKKSSPSGELFCLSCFFEKFLQQPCRLLGSNSAVDCRLVSVSLFKQIDHAAARAGVFVLCAENDRWDTRIYYRPAHIGQGSSVTYIVQPPSRQSPIEPHASRMASISA